MLKSYIIISLISLILEGEVVNKEEKRSGARPPAVSSSLSPLLPALRRVRLKIGNYDWRLRPSHIIF